MRWEDAAQRTAASGWPVAGCGGGRGSGQERGSGGSYWPAVGTEAVTGAVRVAVQQDGWGRTVRESEL